MKCLSALDAHLIATIKRYHKKGLQNLDVSQKSLRNNDKSRGDVATALLTNCQRETVPQAVRLWSQPEELLELACAVDRELMLGSIQGFRSQNQFLIQGHFTVAPFDAVDSVFPVANFARHRDTARDAGLSAKAAEVTSAVPR